MYLQWVLGYASALSTSDASVSASLSRTDAQGVRRWLDNYCQAHPLSRIGDAAESLVAEFRKNSN